MNRRLFLKHAAGVLGVAISASVSAGAMHVHSHSGSASHKSSASKLKPGQKRTINLLAERVIPKTDTPGAIDAGVPEFIDLIVSDWYDDSERRAFILGLSRANNIAIKKYNRKIEELFPEEIDSVLTILEQHSESKNGSTTKTFFEALKELTVVGYFTSELGATKALKHNHMAGQFIGDYPADKVITAWSPTY